MSAVEKVQWWTSVCWLPSARIPAGGYECCVSTFSLVLVAPSIVPFSIPHMSL